MQPNPQARWTDKTIVLDCLSTCKHLATRFAYGALEAATPQVRQAYSQMQREHTQMAEELWNLAKKRGWYPKPPSATRQHEQQVSSQFQSVRTRPGAGQQAGARQGRGGQRQQQGAPRQTGAALGQAGGGQRLGGTVAGHGAEREQAGRRGGALHTGGGRQTVHAGGGAERHREAGHDRHDRHDGDRHDHDR